MERNSNQPDNVEVPTSSPDSSDKEKKSKKKVLRHVPLQAPAQPKIADERLMPKSSKIEESSKLLTTKSLESSTEDSEITKPTPGETQHINAEIAAEHLRAVAEVDPLSAEDRQLADKFLEQVQDGEDVVTAFASAAVEAGMSEDEIAIALAEMPPELDADIEPSEESEQSEQLPLQEEAWELPLRPDQLEDEDTAADVTPNSGAGDGSSPPPPTATSVPVPSGDSRPAAYHNLPIQAEIAPTVTTSPERQDTNRAPAGQILVGALVGYLIGRRRGRIKTEKRMSIVQKKLEKQVTHLEQDITHKEQLLVAAKVRNQERVNVAPIEPAISVETAPAKKAPTEQRMQPGRIETRLGMQKPERTERLAHMIIAAEAPTIAKKLPERIIKPEQTAKPEQVRTMNREQLLAISDKIIVEGASLRKVYESHLIGERQLRHLVGEHLQGKDIHKALRREMVEREIDFERDPILRDRIHTELAKDGDAGGLGSLLASAGVTGVVSDSQLQRHIQKEAQQQRQAEQKRHKQQTTANVALATVVVLLSVAIVVLTFNR